MPVTFISAAKRRRGELATSTCKLECDRCHSFTTVAAEGMASVGWYVSQAMPAGWKMLSEPEAFPNTTTPTYRLACPTCAAAYLLEMERAWAAFWGDPT